MSDDKDGISQHAYAEAPDEVREIKIISAFLMEECRHLGEKFHMNDICAGVFTVLTNIMGRNYEKENRIQMAGVLGIKLVKAMKSDLWDKEEGDKNGS